MGDPRPSLLAAVCSPPCLSPGSYQSRLGKDRTQDRSRGDFRVCSAPPIKPQAAQREDKQSPLSAIRLLALLRVWLWKGHVRGGRHAGPAAARAGGVPSRFWDTPGKADGGYPQPGTERNSIPQSTAHSPAVSCPRPARSATSLTPASLPALQNRDEASERDTGLTRGLRFGLSLQQGPAPAHAGAAGFARAGATTQTAPGRRGGLKPNP